MRAANTSHTDASALIEAHQINDMQPEAAGYNTGVSALSLNFNRIRINWENDGADRSATAAFRQGSGGSWSYKVSVTGLTIAGPPVPPVSLHLYYGSDDHRPHRKPERLHRKPDDAAVQGPLTLSGSSVQRRRDDAVRRSGELGDLAETRLASACSASLGSATATK